jgi:hypothetical protein
VRAALAALAVAALATGGACSKAKDGEAAAPIGHHEPGGIAPTRPAKVAVPDKEPPRPAQLAHVTIKALGMYCEESCPMKVRYALADIKSVYELGFDVSNEAIFVSYDATLGTAKQVTAPMIAAIKGAGFDPWLSKEAWPADAKTQVVLR